MVDDSYDDFQPYTPKYEIGEETKKDLQNRFTYHPPMPGQPDRYLAIRDEANCLAHDLCDRCPKSRELSLALTKLEECVMWAIAAIARNEKED